MIVTSAIYEVIFRDVDIQEEAQKMHIHNAT
jgi:hypothetical protein